MEGNNRKRKRFGGQAQGSRGPLDGNDESMNLPNPMVGFSLPNGLRSVNRSLPAQAIGPPYFYYENVPLALKGVWATISRFMFDIQPEFVDSKFFCAAARKRSFAKTTCNTRSFAVHCLQISKYINFYLLFINIIVELELYHVPIIVFTYFSL